jgi:hypothetical protein
VFRATPRYPLLARRSFESHRGSLRITESFIGKPGVVRNLRRTAVVSRAPDRQVLGISGGPLEIGESFAGLTLLESRQSPEKVGVYEHIMNPPPTLGDEEMVLVEHLFIIRFRWKRRVVHLL